ncbi:hypothetical protein ABID08_000521 [Rhizobium binae]|uniref:Glycosyltransferase RgtA/B/C/D-like domain-containing protein n=1 Tax=Rhizobium binae TaxID=1138190 RepID=A0ABV2MCG2_9HYPH|nr:hypothetical protein [Rhizobium binae]NKL50826.1 hypothetical protein [Rhizobium leguminosarum bv. viciae]MBX4928885.1 hypothetical protein [Rhizobium binae]MBX4966608.1 hypothetical protein [Rhizobium binae]MBX4992111.1 hypothetical protein [Rhizobium binae]QSY84431.1 hypothetical protein J2J99_14500 [Rhizobium binae]
MDRIAAPVHAAGGPEDVTARQDSTVAIIAFVVLVAALIALFRFPPALDYANHYARIWLLSGGIREQPFPEIYALDWKRTFTNVGIDLLATWLGPFVGADRLARALLFLAIVLPPLGAISLHRALFGGRHYWQIAMLSLGWCATMIGGFINFQIGLGMALFFACADLRLQRRNPALLFGWRLAAALLLTVMHIFALGFYMAVVCGLEFSWRFDVLRSKAWLTRLAGRLALAIGACALPPLALYLRTAALPNAGGDGLGLVWNDGVIPVIMNLLSAITTYVPVVDVLLVLPLILICTRAIRAGDIRMHAGLAVAACGLLLLSCVAPLHMLGTGWISWRFPIMAALVAMAMVSPFANLKRRQALLLALVVNLAVFGRTGWIGWNWWLAQKDVAAVEAVLKKVSAGAAVLPLGHEPEIVGDFAHSNRHFAWGLDTFRHLPTLAVPFSHAFVPTLFTAKGKQPLTVLPPWSEIAVPEGNLVSIGVLSCPEMMQVYKAYAPYLSDWRRRFDFILVANGDIPDRYVGDLMPAGLTLIENAGFAKLYAIDKAAPAEPPSAPAGCAAAL